VRRLTLAVLVPGLLGLGACAGQGTIIDWVDFVQWKGITYLAASGPAPAQAVEPALGPQVATTKRKLAGNETDPSYKLQEGDAAFLEAGTPIYGVTGYRPAFRIGVKKAGGIVIYEADTNPTAKTGADLVDLDGKVDYMTIGDSNGRELAAIRDPAVVAHLVGLILQAAVDQSVQPPAAGPQYFVTVHFHDGTQTVRAFWPSTGQLQRGILAGPEFAHAILSAVPSPAA
jgi:hypothetical protein